MPAKILGMIGTQMEGVAVHLIMGQISRSRGSDVRSITDVAATVTSC